MTSPNSGFKNQLEASLNRIPPPIPPSGSVLRRPQESPPPIPPRRNKVAYQNGAPELSKSTGSEQALAQKRRLTLSLSTATSFDTSMKDDGNPGFGACKSPRIETPGTSRIWSPAICTICMEDLFAYAEPTASQQNPLFLSTFASIGREIVAHSPVEETMKPILSTRCGHLFHTECINKWFVEKQEKEIKECPFCKREMMANDTTRIFPIFDND